MSDHKHTSKPIALITGASSGIGLATAEVLAQQGFDVVTCQRRPAPGFRSITADIADPNEPARVIAALDRLDVLVNNAGLMLEGTVEESSLADWSAQIALNLTTPFLMIKAAMPLLKQSQQASIVNVGSIEGIGSNPRHPAYCASKAGLHVEKRHGPLPSIMVRTVSGATPLPAGSILR